MNSSKEGPRVSAGQTAENFYLIGAHNSQKVHELRTFLVRNGVPFQWVDLDTDPLVAFLSSDSLPSSVRWPVCLFPDSSRLEDPSRLQLARKVGLHTKPDLPEYDLAIVGAGPAGLTAAVYAASEGLRTAVVGWEAPGGQAGTSARIENYPGFPEGISGMELTERALVQARKFGAELILANQIAGFKGGHPTVHYLLDGSELACHSEMIATGVAYRRLEAPGAQEFIGRGVYYGSALTEVPLYRDKEVFVAGGVRHGSINRVAWAVGEVSMAVQQVHQFLGKHMMADVDFLQRMRPHPPSRVDLDMSDAA